MAAFFTASLDFFGGVLNDIICRNIENKIIFNTQSDHHWKIIMVELWENGDKHLFKSTQKKRHDL